VTDPFRSSLPRDTTAATARTAVIIRKQTALIDAA